MMKKSYTFGLLAAALIIAPTAAFAGQQDQNNTQILNQSATVGGTNNSVNQHGSQLGIQTQTQLGNRCNSGSQRADNLQVINQDAAVYGRNNHVNQDAIQKTIQSQINAAKNGHCR